MMMNRAKPSGKEIAHRRNEAERILTSGQHELNRRLIRAMGFTHATGFDVVALADSLVDQIGHYARLREAGDQKPFNPSFYFRNLYDEPFTGSDVEFVAYIRRRIAQALPQVEFNNLTDKSVARQLKLFHRSLSHALSESRFTPDMLCEILGVEKIVTFDDIMPFGLEFDNQYPHFSDFLHVVHKATSHFGPKMADDPEGSWEPRYRSEKGWTLRFKSFEDAVMAKLIFDGSRITEAPRNEE